MNKCPEPNEYPEFFAGYVSLVPETDVVSAMENQLSEIENIFAAISEEKGSFAYAEGKWTIKEMIGHISDGERVFAYRALRFSRGDKSPLAGFDQDSYVENSNFNAAKLADLTEEFSNLRKANLIFFKNLRDEMWDKTGISSDNEMSVRALAYIMIGHVRHHINVLKERYLNNL